MFSFFRRRAGVLAVVSLASFVLIIRALEPFLPQLGAIAFWPIIAVLVLGVGGFLFFAGVFLYKSFVVANDAAAVPNLAGYLAGSVIVAFVFWYMMLAVVISMPGSHKQVSREQAASYVAEQLLSGMLLDIMEVYDIRISDVTYEPSEFAFATLTLGMRLTGSFVVASLLVKAFASRK